MSTSPVAINAAISVHLSPALNADEFVEIRKVFRRSTADLIALAQVQVASSGNKFAVNLAIHPLMLPDVLGNEADPRTIGLQLCEFRRRLSETGGDQWWEFKETPESIADAVKQASRVYEAVGRPAIQAFFGAASPFKTVTPEQLQSGELPLFGFTAPEPRMALAFARICRSGGRIKDSKAFARFGLSEVDDGSPLKKDLERLAA